MTLPSNASANAGAFAWFWRTTAERLAQSGLLLSPAASPSAPAGETAGFVFGHALHELDPAVLADRKVRWLLDDASNLQRLTEGQVARLERIYSPLLPDELAAPAGLPKAVFATALAKTRFLRTPPRGAQASEPVAAPHEQVRTPEFSVGFLAVTEPETFVVWQADFTREPQTDAEFLGLSAAIGSLRAPAGTWLLTKPLDRVPLERLQRTAPPGTELIPCATLRAGAIEAIRRKRAGRALAFQASPAPTTTEIEDSGLRFRASSLTAAEIGRLLNLPLAEETSVKSGRPARAPRRRFATAITDWNEGRGGLDGLARALLASGEWSNEAAVAELRAALLVVSPTTPAAFVATVLGRLPLTELYASPTERSRGVAAFGRKLLEDERCGPDEVSTHTVLLLCSALQRDGASFAARFAQGRPRGGLRFELTAATLAWIAQCEWSAPRLPELPERAPEIPGEMLLSAAIAHATSGRWADAHALLNLAHRTHPELLAKPSAGGRFNRLLCWSIVCRLWRDEAQSVAALAWVESTDLTFADQSFLVSRPSPGTPPANFAELPRFATPWSPRR